MTKKELVEKIAGDVNESKAKIDTIISATFDSITESLIKGEEVAIAGFGKFSISKREAREGINPATKERIKIPATKVAKFKAAKQLKEAVK